MSSTVYVIGVGSPVKPTSGVKVTAPVVLSTVQVPSPATTNVSLSPSPSLSVAPAVVMFTVLASNVPSGSVSIPLPLSANGSTTAAVLVVNPVMVSSCVIGVCAS